MLKDCHLETFKTQAVNVYMSVESDDFYGLDVEVQKALIGYYLEDLIEFDKDDAFSFVSEALNVDILKKIRNCLVGTGSFKNVGEMLVHEVQSFLAEFVAQAYFNVIHTDSYFDINEEELRVIKNDYANRVRDFNAYNADVIKNIFKLN